MSFAKKHKKGVIDWGVDTKDFEYFKLSDLYEMNGADEKYVLKGVFVNKNKTEKQLKEYGASPVDPDNHDGVITHLAPDILECEVKWGLESITTNKATGGDGIPVELFQILKDDAVKVLH